MHAERGGRRPQQDAGGAGQIQQKQDRRSGQARRRCGTAGSGLPDDGQDQGARFGVQPPVPDFQQGQQQAEDGTRQQQAPVEAEKRGPSHHQQEKGVEDAQIQTAPDDI